MQRRKNIHYSVAKGPQFALEVKTLETDLTEEMIAS
jgi:phenylalanyl-tRNA synthetase alpha chain